MTDEVQFLRKILYNPFLLEKFKKFDENQKYFSFYDKEEYTTKLEKLILIEIEKMTQETFDIELITSWFSCILEEKYFEDVYLLFHSDLNQILIQKTKELNVDIEFYTNYISQCFEKLEYSNHYEECLNKYLEYKNESYIMNDEFERYVFALNMRDDNNEDNFYYIFNMILDKKYQLSNSEYQNFFKKFCIFSMKQFGFENCKVTFKRNINYSGKHQIEITKNGKRIHHIFMKLSELNVENTLGNLQVMFHEIKHGVQTEELTELYRLDNIKQLEDTILRKILGENFYDINYQYISSESDADVCSYILLGQFLKTYAPLTYRKQKDNLDLEIQKKQLVEDNNFRSLTYGDEYNLQTLFTTVLEQHPEILNTDMLSQKEKEVLLQVYNVDGTPKTPEHYFEAKTQLLNELKMASLNDEEALKNIQKKINFYDTIIHTFQYNLADLKRNYLALEQYQSTNLDINAEVLQYKNVIIDELLQYGQGQTFLKSTIESKMIK